MVMFRADPATLRPLRTIKSEELKRLKTSIYVDVHSKAVTVKWLLKDYHPVLSESGVVGLTPQDKLRRVQLVGNRTDQVDFNFWRDEGSCFDKAKGLEGLVGRIGEHGSFNVVQ